MKTLSICRHAKSTWRFDTNDVYRPLNQRGIGDAPAMARNFSGKQPDAILSSPAVRAYSTALAYVVENNWPFDLLKLEERLLHTSTTEHFELVESLDDKLNNVFIVGHNPGLEDFAEHLCQRSMFTMITAARLSVTFKMQSWRELRQSKAKIQSFTTPKCGSETDI